MLSNVFSSQSDLELSNIDSSDFLVNIDKVPGEFSSNPPETVDMEEILSTLHRDPIRKTPPEPSPSSSCSVVSDLSDKSTTKLRYFHREKATIIFVACSAPQREYYADFHAAITHLRCRRPREADGHRNNPDNAGHFQFDAHFYYNHANHFEFEAVRR